MTGPPTPPPTTAAELLDEEKDKEPATAPVPPVKSPQDPPQPKQDSYQLVFPAIADLASKGDFRELIHVVERTEIVVRDSIACDLSS
jgi:COP9 signalosome complex subunit 8